ncbi:sensor histidine kinase [Sphingomonas sp. PAMC 26605]|uniref:sensor histidine kinase n=1 Tax=Sphingomonas sp. PAMC 26605 TaxID=1112214 RepID=UPI0018DED193|nr:sensor histidine kinase [Sphingomonas sp. PAMC 26605]
MWLKIAILIYLMCGSAADASRSPTSAGLSHVRHTAWTMAQGAPAPIYKIAQDRNGYLWLSSRAGLYRFDGNRFDLIRADLPDDASQAAIPLLVARSGDVWTWYSDVNRFGIYRAGRMALLPPSLSNGTIIDMVEGKDGAIWAGAGQIGAPLLVFRRGRWSELGVDAGLPKGALVNLAATPDGAIWVAYYTGVFRLLPGKARFEHVIDAPLGQSGRLTLDHAGRLWLVGASQLLLLHSPRAGSPILPIQLRWPAYDKKRDQALIMADGSLWTSNIDDGIRLYGGAALSGSSDFGSSMHGLFGSVNGLSSNLINHFFEDREGNVWTATTLGLDRFRVVDIVTEPALTKPAKLGDILLSASDGSVFIGTSERIYRAEPGGGPVPFTDRIANPTAACEGPDHRVWFFNDRKAVGILGSTQITLDAPRVEPDWVADCAVDARGHLWAATLGSGLRSWSGKGWVRALGEAQPSEVMANGRQLVFDWDANRVVAWDGGRLRTLLPADNPIGRLRHVLPFAHGFVVTGKSGIAILGGAKPTYLSYSRVPTLRQASGFILLSNGEAWGAALDSVVRFAPGDFQRALAQPNFRPEPRLFDFLEGLPSSPVSQVKRSLALGGDGRLWISTINGTVWLDSAKLHINRVAPGVAINSLSSNKMRIRDPRDVLLRAGTSDVAIGFSALGLSLPERLQVRYRLDGFDTRWIDPGMRREAFYTNLPPGRYRFLVIAANEDGKWNDTGAELQFELPPTIFQSLWFKGACFLALVGLIALLYHLRVRHVAGQVRAHLEARIAERERIARALHDTLLQSVQGLVLRFQAAADRIKLGDPNKELLERALLRADGIIVEAREHVQDLRFERGPVDLVQMLEDQIAAMDVDPGLSVNIEVRGIIREIPPLIVSDIHRIAAEALFNARQHANASAIEIILHFGTGHFEMVVADDGVGIEKEVLARTGRDGHYGLPGMRERAARIGGRFSIESGPERGTSITLRTPARTTFGDFHPGWASRLRARLLPRRTTE